MSHRCSSDVMASSSAEVTSSEQKRIMLWTIPRSLSTAMCRVMMNSGLKTQIVFEPYGASHYYGPERPSARYVDQQAQDKYSYSKSRDRLMMPYADKELVFAKDIPYHLRPSHLMSEWIPDGYVHTFSIRHPASIVPSLYKVFNELGEKFDPVECSYEEQMTVLRLVKDRGQKVIVVDAEDILDNPEGMLRAYCGATGLQYQPSMLNWDPLTDEQQTFCEPHNPEWFTNAMTDSTITRRPRKEHSAHVGDDVTSDPETRDLLERTIEENLKYYNEMREYCLKPVEQLN